MSDFTPIINSIYDQIVALGLAMDLTVVTVEKAKQHEHRFELDDPYRITIAKSAKPEVYTRWTFKDKRIDFKVEVVIQAPHTDDIATLETYASWREQIMDLFDKPPLIGVNNVFELNATTGEFLDRTKQQSEFDLQQIEVTASITLPY